jgi:hypothetical protein
MRVGDTGCVRAFVTGIHVETALRVDQELQPLAIAKLLKKVRPSPFSHPRAFRTYYDPLSILYH